MSDSQTDASKKPVSVNVITDAEGDDFYALGAFFEEMAYWFHRVRVTVCRGRNVSAKCELVRRYINQVTSKEVEIVEGFSSSCNYPAGCLGVLQVSQHEHYDFAKSTPDFFDVVIVLAPPIDLLGWDLNLFTDSSLYIFGGFNLRFLFDEASRVYGLMPEEFTHDDLYKFFSSFKQVFVATTEHAFHHGEKNIITDPGLLGTGITRKISDAWNRDVLMQLVEKLDFQAKETKGALLGDGDKDTKEVASLTLASLTERYMRAMRSIIGNEHQIIFADPLVMLMLYNPKLCCPCSFSLDPKTSFTILGNPGDGNVQVFSIRDVGLEYCTEVLKKVLVDVL